MDDEFALCWNNFTDNITTGFQNLYDRGDLIDVTLACDGKLLHAHKIVLAICSPYFQEMFLTNPDKHPIIILKDVSFGVMCELLQFMYQGVVNVKQTELSSFMKIAQLLQIKGLTGSGNSNTNSTPKSPTLNAEPEYQQPISGASPSTPTATVCKSFSNSKKNNNLNSPEHVNALVSDNVTAPASENINSQLATKSSHSSSLNNSQQHQSHQPAQSQTSTRIHVSENSSSSISSIGAAITNSSNLKRSNDFPTDALSIYSRKHIKRAASELSDHEQNHSYNSNDSMEQMNPEDVFLPPIPQITMGSGGGVNSASSNTIAGAINSNMAHSSSGDPRFDLVNVKREIDQHSSRSISPSGSSSVAAIRSHLPHFNLDYNIYAAVAANKSLEFPNDLHLPNDFSKSTANHMDIPAAGSAITMLSSTSLLHGSCIFNRNNTVATQQGMKTYWLCKSYRISMCRARCITHQGRVISATGVHNHPPHMKNNEIINMSLFQFPQNQQSQQQSLQLSQSQHQVPSLQQPSSQSIVLSATNVSTSTSSLNQTTANGSTITNANVNNLHSVSGMTGLSVNNGSNNSVGLSVNTFGLGQNSNNSNVTNSININGRLTQNSITNTHQLPPSFQNSTAQSSHSNIITTSNNSNNYINSSVVNGISNNSSNHLQQQQQQQQQPLHNNIMQNVLSSHQNSMMNLSGDMINVSNSLHQQQQHPLSPIHAHQQQPSHHSSLQHLQNQIAQLSPSHLSVTTSPTIHSHHYPHHNNNLQHHHHHSQLVQHHHHSLGSSLLQIIPIRENSDKNEIENSSILNGPQSNRRHLSAVQHHNNHNQSIESANIQQTSSNQNQLDSPITLNQQQSDTNLQVSESQQHHHHHHHHHQHHQQHEQHANSKKIESIQTSNNSKNGESHDNNDNECHNNNDDHSENQSNMLASISMSDAGQHNNFKIEDI